jgi:type II secretory pathway pseudopilin PulG
MNRRAFSLMELAVAIIVMGAALAPLMTAIGQQGRYNREARDLTIAMALAREEIDYLRSIEYTAINNQLTTLGQPLGPGLYPTTSGLTGAPSILNPVLVGPSAAGWGAPYDSNASSEYIVMQGFSRQVELIWTGSAGGLRQYQGVYALLVRVTITNTGSLYTTPSGVGATAHQLVTLIGRKY